MAKHCFPNKKAGFRGYLNLSNTFVFIPAPFPAIPPESPAPSSPSLHSHWVCFPTNISRNAGHIPSFVFRPGKQISTLAQCFKYLCYQRVYTNIEQMAKHCFPNKKTSFAVSTLFQIPLFSSPHLSLPFRPHVLLSPPNLQTVPNCLCLCMESYTPPNEPSYMLLLL